MVGFRIPDDQYDEIEKIASERGQTIAEFLRKIVDNELYPNKADLQDEGVNLVQRVDDLETNMEEIYGKEDGDGTDGLLADIGTRIETLEASLKTINGELNSKQDSLKDLVNEFNDKVAQLTDKIDDITDFIKRSTEIFNARTKKLHLCPDCGSQLHLHSLDDNSWQLECFVCGYFSPTFETTKWKEKAGKNPVSLKEAKIEELDVFIGKQDAPGWKYIPQLGFSIKE